MRKLLIPIVILAGLFDAGCANDPIAVHLPWVYRIDVQQGNVITQTEVNQLATGMSKRQVLYVMGTPAVEDPFHAGRWDYIYDFQSGEHAKKQERHHVTLYFDNDTLARIEGDLQPIAGSPPPDRQVTVVVPPQEHRDEGLLTRFWYWLGFGKNG